MTRNSKPLLFVNDLTVIDCSYLHPERGILGESWIVDLTLGGELNEQGMMMDFGLVKKSIKAVIDEAVDHRFLIPGKNASVTMQEEDTILDFSFSDGRIIHYEAPAEATAVLEVEEITMEAVVEYLSACISCVVPSNVAEVDISLRTEDIEGAFYHYSHGLKKHEGNCQRIVHGHRSRIQIDIEGGRSYDSERMVAEVFEDIYIGTASDIISRYVRDGFEYIEFGYSAGQGSFKLVIPANTCYVIPTDSTVENIALILADLVASEVPGMPIRVRAFEGVEKGAISTIAP